jgi:hypothetical protein
LLLLFISIHPLLPECFDLLLCVALLLLVWLLCQHDTGFLLNLQQPHQLPRSALLINNHAHEDSTGGGVLISGLLLGAATILVSGNNQRPSCEGGECLAL